MIPTTEGDEPDPPSFSALVARYTSDPEDPPETATVSLSAALASGDDPWQVLSYLDGLGIVVRCLDDLTAINEDDTEEELHAFRCAEGIAVSIASHGQWILFMP